MSEIYGIAGPAHPDGATRARLALDPCSASAAARAHLDVCGVCAEEVAGLEAAAAATRLIESLNGGSDCLDEHVIAGLADGSLDAERHSEVLPHLKACPACVAAVGGVAAAVAAPPVAREMERLRRGKRAWRHRVAAGIAAAILLVIAWPANDDSGRHRAVTLIAGSVPAAVSPAGAVPRPERLVWTSAAGADLYRVVVFDSAGSVVFEASTADTTAVIPDSLWLRADRRYLWRVDARIGWDRWSSSEFLEFSVRGRRNR